jgi:hypothetical protein
VKGSGHGVVALTGDPARVKGGELLTARRSTPPSRRTSRRPCCWRGPRPRRCCGATRAGRSCWSQYAGRLPVRGDPGVRLAEGARRAALILAKVRRKADIRVNVVAPGATVVGMARASIDAARRHVDAARSRLNFRGRRPRRALPRADSYVTGQVITVDGGRCSETGSDASPASGIDGSGHYRDPTKATTPRDPDEASAGGARRLDLRDSLARVAAQEQDVAARP